MGTPDMEKYQNRRMMTSSGWTYFCSQCMDYKLETEFYKSKDTPFGITYKCKIHYQKNYEHDPEMDYLKLQPVTQDDYQQTKKLLEKLGYTFGKGELPVWEQFLIKHKLK